MHIDVLLILYACTAISLRMSNGDHRRYTTCTLTATHPLALITMRFQIKDRCQTQLVLTPLPITFMQPVTPQLLTQVQDLRRRLPHRDRRVAVQLDIIGWGHINLDNWLQKLEKKIRELPERQIDPALHLLGLEEWNLKFSKDILAGRIAKARFGMKKPLKWWHCERMDGLNFALSGLQGMTEELGREKERIPEPWVVRYVPPPPDVPFDSSPPPDWLAMFVPSEVPSVCIEDHNACCTICCEDFKPPRLNEQDQEDDEDIDLDILFQLPCQHVLHKECLKNIDKNVCPVCRAQFSWKDRPPRPSVPSTPSSLSLSLSSSSRTRSLDDGPERYSLEVSTDSSQSGLGSRIRSFFPIFS
ncbi:hypothetical protein D9758_008097 [Tetrapyrgos nigripes]|uniref:RING-type domain-containing protein n=1 Tax=Tetrapyrgos nigripes TaxID=182062 RepID=A0A8H5GHN4_9AGAR|nr:hypothetical protein D9758_008097 [Tetrapyrgos nigripes]